MQVPFVFHFLRGLQNKLITMSGNFGRLLYDGHNSFSFFLSNSTASQHNDSSVFSIICFVSFFFFCISVAFGYLFPFLHLGLCLVGTPRLFVCHQRLLALATWLLRDTSFLAQFASDSRPRRFCVMTLDAHFFEIFLHLFTHKIRTTSVLKSDFQ